MIIFIAGYLLGVLLGITFISLVHKAEDRKNEELYEQGFLDGIQSLR